jgi:sialate O-acetylesterase
MRHLLALPALAVSLLAQAGTTPSTPAFRARHLFGDHMVLPQHSSVPISGFGEPGAAVEVHGSWGAKGETIVQQDGHWHASLATPARGGPFEVTLHSNLAEVVLRDVLIGDVWLGSGQSNMEMPIGNFGGWKGGVRDWQKEVAAADHPQLRVFTVQRATSGVPLDDVEGEWQVSSPATAESLSASAYFFGRELLERGKGPIGLVVSCWGGTVCEAWVSERGLKPFPEFASDLEATRPVANQSTPAERMQAFWAAVPAEGQGAKNPVEMPDLWSKSGLGDFDGVMFYRCKFELPEAMVGADLVLELGAIDDMDTVWCNGARIGGMEHEGAWSSPRRYSVPASRATVGHERAQIELVVRVVDTGGEGGFSAEPSAMRLVRASDPQQQLALASVAWTRQQGPRMSDLPRFPSDENGGPNRPAVLWNAMMAPLVPFPFTGAIWYQGESNRGRAEQYSRLFPAMIEDWRRAFASELPFYFVQIAPHTYSKVDDETAPLREAQAAALRLQHTGMVVTLDVGDARDIHPKDKQSIGKRLALQALRDHYGENVVADGPRPQRITRDGTAVRIEFAAADGGLFSDGELKGFEVAGADGVFHAASARIDGAAVVVKSSDVAEPDQVRHAWAGLPQWSLRNGAGLPAWPFLRAVQ